MSEKQFLDLLPLYQCLGNIKDIQNNMKEIFKNFSLEDIDAILSDIDMLIDLLKDLSFDLTCIYFEERRKGKKYKDED